MEQLIDVFAKKIERLSGIERDDALQELRIVVWNASRSYDDRKGDYSHYISRALKHESWRMIRQERKRVRYEREVQGSLTRITAYMEDEIVDKLFIEHLRSALAQQSRSVLDGYLEGMTHREIGDRLHLARSRITNIMTNIKETAIHLYSCEV